MTTTQDRTQIDLSDPQRAAIAERLIEGLTIISGENVLGWSGHLSKRLPDGSGFMINPRFAGMLASAEDLCIVNYDGVQLEGRFPMPSETPIHTGIYGARPDVESVLHTHPRNAVIVGLLDCGFIPIHREAQRFLDGVSVFRDSRHVVDAEQARELAEVLGQRKAAFMVGHGIAIAEKSIEDACTAGINLEQSCEDQLKVMSVATAIPLAEAHGGTRTKVFTGEGVGFRNWPYLRVKHGLITKDAIKPEMAPPAYVPSADWNRQNS